jgi:hypothetical protein
MVRVPLASLSECSESIKQQLTFLRCQFGCNIVYTSDRSGSKTQGSLLIPATLVCTDPIHNDGLFCIVTTKPGMRYIRSSPKHLDTFGVDDGNVPCDLETFIQRHHSETEMRRIRLEIHPDLPTTKKIVKSI